MASKGDKHENLHSVALRCSRMFLPDWCTVLVLMQLCFSEKLHFMGFRDDMLHTSVGHSTRLNI